MPAAANRARPAKTAGNRISSCVVHCVFITSSCVALACALVALGTACYVVGSSPDSGPCPRHLQGVVFGVAGGLVVASAILFNWISRKRKRKLERLAMEELAAKGDNNLSAEESGTRHNALYIEDQPAVVASTIAEDDEELCVENATEELDRIIQEQKSADVSYWIEHQEPPPDFLPPPPELPEIPRPLDKENNLNNSRSEVTAL